MQRTMSRWMWPIVVVIGMAGIVAAVFEGYGAYQSHLSDDFRQTLTVALEPTVRLGEIRRYLGDVRLGVHTQKDRELEAKFERLVALTEENCDAEEASMRSERKAAVESLEAADVDQEGPAVSGSQVQEMDAAVGTAHLAFDKYMACEKKINRDREAIPVIMGDLRAALRGAGPAMLPK